MRRMSVHPTAIVSPDARLGRDVAVGPFAVIEEGAVIGDGCEIRAHAVVKRFTSLGVGNRVHEGAVLGGEPQDLSFRDLETGLRIGDRNVIREGVTIHRSTKEGGATVVGSDCFLMAYVHVAHDNRIGDRVIMANNVMLAGHVEVGGARLPRRRRPASTSSAGSAAWPWWAGTRRSCRTACRSSSPTATRRAPAASTSSACDAPAWRPPQLRVLEEAYRLLLRSGLALEEALAGMAALGDPLVDEWTAFVRGSKRGFAHAHRRGAKDEA